MFGFGKPTNPAPAKSDTVTDSAEANDQVGEIMPSGTIPRKNTKRSSVDALGNQKAHKYYHNSRLVTNIESIYE